MKHHTKTKGDEGVGFVIADLFSRGIQVAIPISEHLPFDLIAVLEDGSLKRVSVKYRKAVNGVVKVMFRSTYSDKNGMHIKKLDKCQVDIFAIYCPDTGKVYYVDHNLFREAVNLRITAPRNRAKVNIHFAEDFMRL